METFFKSVLAPVLIIAAVIALYLGAYLPYEKASLFINALQQSSQATSLQELENDFNAALQFYSPVGQQEVERYTGNQILSILGQKGITPQVSQALADYLGQVLHLDKPSTRGLDFTQEFLLAANAYQIAWMGDHSPADYALAEKYYQEGLKLSPTRPQLLYGLLQLYANGGQATQALQVAEEIHKYWPSDSQVASLIPELQKAASSTPAFNIAPVTSSVQVTPAK